MVDSGNVQRVHNSENHDPLFPTAPVESVNRTFSSKEGG